MCPSFLPVFPDNFDRDIMLRMHRCPFQDCDYQNLQKSNVDTHIRTQQVSAQFSPFHLLTVAPSTGEKSRLCPDCDFASADPGSLTRHRKRFHGYVPKPRQARVKARGSDSSKSNKNLPVLQLTDSMTDYSRDSETSSPGGRMYPAGLSESGTPPPQVHTFPHLEFTGISSRKLDLNPYPGSLFASSSLPNPIDPHPHADRSYNPTLTATRSLKRSRSDSESESYGRNQGSPSTRSPHAGTLRNSTRTPYATSSTSSRSRSRSISPHERGKDGHRVRIIQRGTSFQPLHIRSSHATFHPQPTLEVRNKMSISFALSSPPPAPLIPNMSSSRGAIHDAAPASAPSQPNPSLSTRPSVEADTSNLRSTLIHPRPFPFTRSISPTRSHPSPSHSPMLPPISPTSQSQSQSQSTRSRSRSRSRSHSPSRAHPIPTLNVNHHTPLNTLAPLIRSSVSGERSPLLLPLSLPLAIRERDEEVLLGSSTHVVHVEMGMPHLDVTYDRKPNHNHNESGSNFEHTHSHSYMERDGRVKIQRIH